VTGYMQVTSVDGETISNAETWRVTGQFDGQDLELTFPCYLSYEAEAPKVSLYISLPGYSATDNEVSGTFSADDISTEAVPTRGTITLTQVTPGS